MPKIRGSTSASIPTARVAHVEISMGLDRARVPPAVAVDLAVAVAGPDRDRTPLGGELDRILEQVPEDLLEPDRVGVDVVPAGGEVQVQTESGRVRDRPGRSRATRWISSCASTASRLRCSLPPRTRVRSRRSSISRTSRLTLRRIISITARIGSGVSGRSSIAVDRGEDRVEGRAELVAERRQEVVLGPVGRLGLGPRRLLPQHPDPPLLGPLATR